MTLNALEAHLTGVYPVGGQAKEKTNEAVQCYIMRMK